jgi:hypothetical protein
MSSVLESHREQSSVSAMRGLLAEMGGLSALGAEAATETAEAAKETAGGSKAWNESLGFISARYVQDRCLELLSVVSGAPVVPWVPWVPRVPVVPVEGGRVSKVLTAHLDELRGKLGNAAEWEEKWSPLNDRDVPKFEEDRKAARRAVLGQYKTMFPEVKELVNSLVPTTGLTWTQTREALRKQTQPEIKRLGWVTQTRGAQASDALAVALSALLTALHQYFDRYINTKKVMTWTDA